MYEDIWRIIKKRLDITYSDNIIIELYIILFAIIITIICSLITHKILLKQKKSSLIYKRTFIPLYNPIIAILTLVILYTITNKFITNIPILYGLLNISFIWLIASITLVCTKNMILARVIIYSIIMIYILDIFNVLDDTINHLDSIAINFANFKISILFLLKLILSFAFILWATRKLIFSGVFYIRKLKLKYNTKELIVKFFELSVYFIAGIIFLQIIGVDLTTLGVMGGAIFFGIGIGLQKIVLNLISGIILLLEDVIKENDVIELENGVTGSVKFIGARYILIKTFSGKEMLIPNEEFIVKKVINWTLSDNKVRLDIKIPISYNDDLKKVQRLILEAIANYEHLEKNKEPHCFLSKFSDSAIIFTLRFWVDNIIVERTQKPKSDVMFLIWEKFQAHNIKMPFPQREIHIQK